MTRYRAPQPNRTLRNLLTLAILVAALAVGTAAVVSRPHPVVSVGLAPDTGVSTALGNDAWLWSGRGLCLRAERPIGGGLLRVSSAGITRLALPLLVVRSLASGPEGLLASGRDASCHPSTVLSTDRGQTWIPLSNDEARSLDVGRAGRLWSVDAGVIPRLRRGGSLRGAAVLTTQPCPADVPASLVSSAGADSWLLCQDAEGLRRTLAHTTDDGLRWNVPGNEQSGTGLDGVGLVRVLDLGHAPYGWLLKPARRCPEGELRATSNSGAAWTELPCPRTTIPVSQVLTVSFTDRVHGLLLGVRGARTVLAHTTDGGRTWSQQQAAQ